MSDIREASLEPDHGLPGGAVIQAGPFALLAAGALWLWTRWSTLPDRLPAHWNWRGDPDRFVSRSALGVAMPLLVGALVCLLLFALQAGIRHGAARAPLRRPSLRVLLALEYLSAVVSCGTLGAMATDGRMLTPLLAACGAGFVAILAMALNIPRTRARNPAAWHAGFFYVDRDDPALLVPKRIGIGYTFNFGNPRAVLLAAVLGALALSMAIVAISAR